MSDTAPVAEPPHRSAALFARYLDLVERRTGWLLLALGAIAIAALAFTVRLELHTAMEELLPDQHPAVLALRRISGRQKASTNLVLLIESPSDEANRRLAQALRTPFEQMVPSVFSEIQWHPNGEIPEFASHWRWLYADRSDLEQAEELLDRLIAHRSQPLVVDLEDDPEKELRALRQRLEQQLPARPTGDHASHFIGHEGNSHFLGIMLWRRGDGLASVGDQETLSAVQRVVGQLQPHTFHPQMEVQYTGAIAMGIDEHNAIRDDLTIATAICASLVLLVIYLYFRRAALLLVIGAPAFLGLLLALAMAQITIHYLNANTAFLISIILGNGINSPIILLARYGEERRRGTAVRAALEQAMAGTLLATGTAMAAASIAYGSLLATSFRGFSQFGLVGGAGMLLVWIATFLLVPPLVVFGERLRPGLLTPRPSLLRRPFAWIGRVVAGSPRLFALVILGLVAASVLPLQRYLADPMEWNFGNLRSAETRSQRNWSKMYRLGMGDVGAGHIATDAVLLVDRPEQADPVAEALRVQDRARGQDHILKEVRTLSSMLPREQPPKLEILRRLRAKIDRHRELMSAEERAEVAQFRPPDDLRPLTVDDLPRPVRENFTEVGGQRGRLVGIDATNFSDWNGHDLLRLAKALRVEALGQTWVAASTSTVFAGMIETIVRDGPRVSWIAFLGVLALIVWAFRWGAGPVVLSLLIGMVWLGALLAKIHLQLNFVNFIAVPITLGVGTDYAANIWDRLRREGADRIVEVIADTGSAVALCSATTIIGYSSLLLASNRALKSFGLLADLGEVACLAAALLALPSLIGLRRRWSPVLK